MIDMNEIILKLKNNKSLTIKEKFYYIKSNKVNLDVFKYLSDKFINLKIEICGQYEGNVLDLMKQGLLEGWCWQTTETVSIFLNDDDYIERGNLKFTGYRDYYHSWICFNYNDEEYVFDPCLDMLCQKDLYTEIFETEVKGLVTAKEVQDDLIMRMNALEKEKEITEVDLVMRAFLEKYGSYLLDKEKDRFYVVGNDDVNSPMYRNNTGYKVNIEDGKVKKLVAHYYKSK